MKLGIITDIHEDAERLSIAISALEKLNCDEIICLGDISGFDDRFYSYRFSRNLSFCIDCIINNCKIIVPGNHDLNHLKRLPSYNGVFSFPDNWYDLSPQERKNISAGRIWLYDNDYPINCKSEFEKLFAVSNDRYFYDTDNFRILFTHSVSPDISGLIAKKPSKHDDFTPQFLLLSENKCNIGISGHLHPNGLLRIDEKKIYNPKFAELELPEYGYMQFICPCIADGMQDNGFTVIDTKELTIESIPLRTPRHNSYLI
jgi:predicted phosphodiesterase